MALALRNHRYEIPAALAGILANPRLRNELMAQARARGGELANVVRNWYNNLGNDNDYNFQDEYDDPQQEPDSTNNMDTQVDAPPTVNAAASSNSNLGARPSHGRLKGNTTTKFGWERKFFERDIFRSRKVETQDMLWGFSQWPIKDSLGQYIDLKRWSNCYGVVYRPEQTGNDPTKLNIFNFYGDHINPCQVSIADHCYAQPVNFYVHQFIDKKILSEKGGALRNFVKVRLLKFSVKIQFVTRNQNIVDLNNGAFHLVERFSGAPQIFSAVASRICPATDGVTHTKYWVYRDMYGDFLNPENIQILNPPNDSKASVTAQDKLPRTAHHIRAYDNNLCVCGDSEPFFFERQINAQSNYYITPQKIWDMRENNIAVLVNTIEGQYGSSTVINQVPEYYNLLVVPCNVVWYESDLIRIGGTDAAPLKGHVILSGMTTSLSMTFNATWEAFNYNHKGEMQATTLTTTVTDPLELAELNYNVGLRTMESQLIKNVI